MIQACGSQANAGLEGWKMAPGCHGAYSLSLSCGRSLSQQASALSQCLHSRVNVDCTVKKNFKL